MMSRFWAWVALLTLGGCTVGPDFVPPAGPVADHYDLARLPTAEQGALPGPSFAETESLPADWWRLFRCPALDEMETMALAANHTVAAAQANLRQAEQEVAQQQAAWLPQLSLAASASRNGTGVTTPTPSGIDSFSVGPSLSYMADLFGETRRAVEQSVAERDVQQWQWQAARLTVTGGVASESLAIAGLHLQLDSVAAILESDQQNLSLVEHQLAVGHAARGDLLAAQSQLVGDRPPLAQLHQQLSVARHALAVLVGQPPGNWTMPEIALADVTVPAPLPSIVPSALIHHRPDILAAEASLHADSAAIGVAEAQFYPSLSLSAGLSQQSLTARQLFQSSSTLWSVGAGLAAPLYRGGALDAQKQAAIDAFQAQSAVYQQTVLTAFGQVADSLRSLQNDDEAVADSQAALDVAAASLDVQRVSYQTGKTSLPQLLVAQRSYATARQGWAVAQTQKLQDVVQFFLAMGGGTSPPAVQ